MKELGLRLQQCVVSLPGRLRRAGLRDVARWAAAVLLFVLLYVLALIPFTPSIADLRKEKEAKPSVVLSVDGKELAVFRRSNREWVKLADISPSVVAALISTEDHRFYEHHGLDFRRTASAMLHTFSGDLQGGSTLTQQLARNLYPEEIGRAPTLRRKIKEAITALKIEVVYTKSEILETYLNTVPFLYNAFGIEMAARTYFDKPAGKLDVLESATLVGMLKGTSYYNPVQNPERSLQRRNTVLGQMVKHGKLKPANFESLKKKPLKIDFGRQSEDPGAAPHLTQQLRHWLIEWADRNSYNIYADGLVLRTTIDSRLQAMANEAVTRQADRLQKLATAQWGSPSLWNARSGPMRELVRSLVRGTPEFKAALDAGQPPEQALAQLEGDADFMQTLRESKTRLQAGFLALDPRNGAVRAWVGSRNFAQDPFDHVEQARRQPGSTFKPFVYGAAFENGALPSDRLLDQEVQISLGHGAFWRPSDEGGPSGQPMTLREGLMYSKNTITAQVMQAVGPEHVARLAHAMGVRQSRLDEVPSLALGTSPVTLKEMVASYSTIANEGRYVTPRMITRVEDRQGGALEVFNPDPPETVLPVAVAHLLLDVMRGVIDQGTGSTIRSRYGIQADVAGKTGTTQDNTDGWFILMHPHLVAGAWVGFNDNRITMGDSWGQGARSALPMVGDFFVRALRSGVLNQRVAFPVVPSVNRGDPQLIAPRLGQPIQVFNAQALPEPPAGSQASPAYDVQATAAPQEAVPMPVMRSLPAPQLAQPQPPPDQSAASEQPPASEPQQKPDGRRLRRSDSADLLPRGWPKTPVPEFVRPLR